MTTPTREEMQSALDHMNDFLAEDAQRHHLSSVERESYTLLRYCIVEIFALRKVTEAAQGFTNHHNTYTGEQIRLENALDEWRALG